MKKRGKWLVSVIIPTYNEEEDIGACLDSILKQSYKQIEIIVVDDGSTDRTIEIVKKFKKVKLIKGEHKGPGFSRNKGAKKAKGKILSFVDADMVFDKNYIKYLVKPIMEGKSMGTEEILQKAMNLDNSWSRCWGSYTKEYKVKMGEMKKGNVFRAILREKFFEMGGFDPKYGYADDITFYLKHGVKPDIVDGAFCYHKNPETLDQIWKQSRWIGASLPTRWKVFRTPIANLIALIVLYFLGIFAIPLLAIRKMIKLEEYSLFFHFFVFYIYRYYGSLAGLFNYIVRGRNVR